jgi:isoquinoline 1-oxidoreductase beta subunit
MNRGLPITRRSFLASVVATGGSLSLGFAPALEGGTASASEGGPEITAWIVINPDNSTIIRLAKSEMGQGVSTALPMLVAEELECDWTKVKSEYVSPDDNLRLRRPWGSMATGASRSIRESEQALRTAGATARSMLVSAAAAQWQVPVSECRAHNGVITHAPSGRALTFGSIAAAAAQIEPPKRVELKHPAAWKLAGTRQRRLDVPDKVQGKTIYGIDVRLPDMLYAAVMQCPVFGGSLKSVDATPIAGMKGVRKLIRLEQAVAVIADSWWRAKRALAALDVVWDQGENAEVTSESLAQLVRQGLVEENAGVGRKDGDFAAAFAQAQRRVESDYIVPFLGHATMEPQNATVHFRGNEVEVWAPTQNGEATLMAAARAAGLPPSKVMVHKTAIGGGFGRRGFTQDFVALAVRIASAVPQPVKMLWTREEDMRHDFYRPMVAARMRAGLDEDGGPTAWHVRLSGPSLLDVMSAGRVDRAIQQGFVEDMAYDIPNYVAEHAPCKISVPLGPWRSVPHSHNCFFKECFIDELAHAAGDDPYRYRLKLLRRHPRAGRLAAVLTAAAQKADWGTPLRGGLHRGIAVNELAMSCTAAVVEVSVQNQLRVHRVILAIDCGIPVNPLTIEMEVQSAAVWALSAAIYGEITLKDGRVEQSNFHDYPVLALSEMPVIETVIVPSANHFGGVGEPPVAVVAPALCNAIFQATGRRIRSLPLKTHGLVRLSWSPP